MWLSSLRRTLAGNPRSSAAQALRRRRIIPMLDRLEDRITPTTTINVNAGDVAGLTAAINQADSNADSTGYIINLDADGGATPYSLSAALPTITAANLTIQGNGATIKPSSSVAVRLLNASLASGDSLTLNDLTLTGGKVTAGVGQNAQGGALFVSGGKVNLTNCTITNNSLMAGNGGTGQNGGNAQGGGIYANGTTLTISGGKVNGQTINAGDGGAGASGATGGASSI
jgi:fibronectin-binding autotransporter adhesin